VHVVLDCRVGFASSQRRGYSDHAARSFKMPSLRGLQGRDNPVVPLDVMENLWIAASALPPRNDEGIQTMRHGV